MVVDKFIDFSFSSWKTSKGKLI